MKNYFSRRGAQVFVILLVVTTTVVGWLWWTKSIAFTHTAVVQFGVESTEPDDGTLTAVFIDVEASEFDLTKTSERLARTIDAAEALSSHLGDVSPSGVRTFTYTVIDQGN
ncbi:hypothetical protein R3Q06_21020 [Rhodococcus erythropolis]|uniref:hypothetical protein n=1 Tax=Rhodococcus erythropolis TaxID=1833 RepID=UPI002949A681|nr:hypothetical protein [Rhodococcus erythropolis]MDV6275981.1 hypothetical protein [Rhodococcus erythropolis]